MKNTFKTLILVSSVLVFGMVDTALAQPSRHYGRDYQSSRYQGYNRPSPRHYDSGSRNYGYGRNNYDSGRHHNSRRWEGAAAALIVTGLVGAAIMNSRTYEPAPVYTVAPPSVNPNAWYYCDSARSYYPQAQFCPEGWRIVE